MYKLVNIYDVEFDGNMVIDARVRFITTLENDSDEIIIKAYKEYNCFLHDNGTFMVWKLDDKFENAECINVVFDSDPEDIWVDCAEWDFRVISSVAAREIGINLNV